MVCTIRWERFSCKRVIDSSFGTGTSLPMVPSTSGISPYWFSRSNLSGLMPVTLVESRFLSARVQRRRCHTFIKKNFYVPFFAVEVRWDLISLLLLGLSPRYCRSTVSSIFSYSYVDMAIANQRELWNCKSCWAREKKSLVDSAYCMIVAKLFVYSGITMDLTDGKPYHE
jgi:hypothetical protein